MRTNTTMEHNVYRVRVIIDRKTVDMDMCPTTEEEIIFEDIMASKTAAIKACQSYFDKQPLNNYVTAVWAAVYPVKITRNGSITGSRIYNKYKSI